MASVCWRSMSPSDTVGVRLSVTRSPGPGETVCTPHSARPSSSPADGLGHGPSGWWQSRGCLTYEKLSVYQHFSF